jgi:hypothetical protein
MTEDITSLQIRILYDSVTEAERRLRKLEGTADKTGRALGRQEKQSKSLAFSILKLAGAYITLRSAGAALRAIIRTTAEFQQLNAQLVTATGNAKDAADAFAAIKDFAAQTPFDLQQATGAFISLVNRGLTPSERALRSYGNTASSMGFQLADMVLAVSNATAGEFETLKRFGIRAAKEGENVNFTFRGVTTSVKNNIDEIESYFIGLGESNFSGGMERQMDTLTGAFSNLGDAWQVMLATIGEKGIGDAVENGVRFATDLISDFTAALESGQVEAILDSWKANFSGLADVAQDVFSALISGLSDFVDFAGDALGFHEEDINGKAVDPWDNVKSVLADVPVWFGEMLELVTGTLNALSAKIFEVAERARVAFQGIIEDAATAFRIQNAGANGGRGAGAKPLVPGAAGSGTGSFGSAFGFAKDEVAGNQQRRKDYVSSLEDSVFETGAQTEKAIYDSWEKTIAKTGDALVERETAKARAGELRAEFDSNAAERAKNTEDRLKRFRVGGGGGGGGATGGGGGKKGGGGGGRSAESEFERLAKQLQDEETLISQSYERRRKLIEENTRAGSQTQVDLMLALTAKHEEEQMRRLDILKREPETMFAAFAEERRILQENFDLRRDIILSSTEATEKEKHRLLAEAELEHTALVRRAMRERNEMEFGLAADFFENISTMAAAFGAKGSKIAKAAAIAQTTIKTYESATSAYASLAGIPVIGPALGAAAAGAAIAAGFANIQAIRATNYSGAYATGGSIPPGKFGLVGEAGPEFVRGPALVTSARATADRMGGASAPKVSINVQNYGGGTVDVQEQRNGDEILINMIVEKAAKRAKSEFEADVRKGGTRTARALQETFKLSRVG